MAAPWAGPEYGLLLLLVVLLVVAVYGGLTLYPALWFLLIVAAVVALFGYSRRGPRGPYYRG